jgi:RNA polymerase sigma-70 factor (ECF subfamily)
VLAATIGSEAANIAAPIALVVSAARPIERVMRPESEGKECCGEASPEDLISAVALQRDRSAFIRLFALYGPRIKGYLIRQCAEPATAEDLTQEVMLTVWRRAHQFDRAKAGASTWIFTIARNRRIDGLRRTRRPEFDPNDPALVPDTDASADEMVDAGQRNKRLHSAITALPTAQATLLRLAYFEDKSHSIIAKELSIPLGTVKSRLRLAMEKLRGALEEFE